MLKINFYPFPVLETKHLILRRIDLNDATAIFLLKSNPKTMEFIPKPLVKTIDEALKHIAIIDSKIKNNEGINWAITLKGNSKLIGIIGNYKIKPENYRCEIGYMLMPEFSGKGIISEAINKVLDYSFTILQMHSMRRLLIRVIMHQKEFYKKMDL